MRTAIVPAMIVMLCLSIPRTSVGQETIALARWPAQPVVSTSPAVPAWAGVPDSVRRKVGYHHWTGAAIGGGVGGVTALVLALAARGSCADCPSGYPNVPAAGLVGAGLGGAFGFLVGLASPKYAWVPRAGPGAGPEPR
jgi:hypothetical protein